MNIWIKFPERVWEPSGLNAAGLILWSSRPATKQDWAARKLFAETLGCNAPAPVEPIVPRDLDTDASIG